MARATKPTIRRRAVRPPPRSSMVPHAMRQDRPRSVNGAWLGLEHQDEATGAARHGAGAEVDRSLERAAHHQALPRKEVEDGSLAERCDRERARPYVAPVGPEARDERPRARGRGEHSPPQVDGLREVPGHVDVTAVVERDSRHFDGSAVRRIRLRPYHRPTRIEPREDTVSRAHRPRAWIPKRGSGPG